MKHEYPSNYPPGTHWAVDEAWRILDTLEPGALQLNTRAFLAGMIAGALIRVRDEEPWENEPPKYDFDAEGLKCALRRGYGRAWCGYVAVPHDHPWFGLPLNTLIKPAKWMLDHRSIDSIGPMNLFATVLSDKNPEEELVISSALAVHGGVTYSDDHCATEEPDGNWWFGFDCGHAGDLIPDMPNPGNFEALKGFATPEMIEDMKRLVGPIMKKMTSTYRDLPYVVGECQSLAHQLIRVKEEAEAWQLLKVPPNDMA